MNNSLFAIATAGIIATGCTQSKQEKKESTEEKPNFVIIFCDDLGYGDIGCFGANDIKTPNIDNIAEQGIKFTEFYSASPVSSPSRAGLLTGRMPQRMGINSVFFPESFTGMPTNEITLADMLREKGYTNGIIGKWHLGHRKKYLPLQRGFDYYFGIPYSNDMESVVYMEGNEVVDFHVDQHYTTKTYTEKACNFIDKHHEKPFFLYLAHNMPHVPIYASEDFMGTSERGLYGDVIQEIDWSVGKVLEKLKEYGLTENTFVFFSSDNGPWLVMEERGGSSGILREGKQYTFEGGMRVPTVAMWPKVIEPGKTYDKMASMMDIFPTFSEIVDVELPQDRVIDGKNILPVLNGTGERINEKYLFYNLPDPRCYREGDWKYKKPFKGYEGSWWKKAVPAHPELLFNLENDPSENHNLADSLPDKLKQMKNKFDSAIKAMGELPPSLVIRTKADNKHIKYLKEKYKKDNQ